MLSNKRLIPIFIVVFVDILGFSIILPLLPYYADTFTKSELIIGMLVATYSICQFVASPIIGDLSDKFGRRPLLVYSQVGSLMGFILLGLAPSLPHPLLWLFVSRTIDGISGGNITIAQAYISDVTEAQDRAKSYGLIGIAFGLGFLIGPMLGGVLSQYSYSVPAYVAAGFSLLSIVATLILIPETEHKPDPERRSGIYAYTRILDYGKLVTLRRLLITFFFFVLPFAMYVSLFGLYANRQLQLTAKETGYFLGFVGFLGILWQGRAVGPLVKKLGERKALRIGLAASVIGLFTVVAVDVWWKLIIVAVFFSFGTSVTRPSLMSLITQSTPADRRGGVLGVTTSLESLSRIIAPIVGGWVIAFHPTWIGWVGGSLIFVAFILSTVYHD